MTGDQRAQGRRRLPRVARVVRCPAGQRRAGPDRVAPVEHREVRVVVAGALAPLRERLLHHGGPDLAGFGAARVQRCRGPGEDQGLVRGLEGALGAVARVTVDEPVRELLVPGAGGTRRVGDRARQRPGDRGHRCDQPAVPQAALDRVEELRGLVEEAAGVDPLRPGRRPPQVDQVDREEPVENPAVEDGVDQPLGGRTGRGDLEGPPAGARGRDASDPRSAELPQHRLEVLEGRDLLGQVRCLARLGRRGVLRLVPRRLDDGTRVVEPEPEVHR